MDLIERFLSYVSVPTMSDENSETCPSSEKEWVLARMLTAELEKIGLSDVECDENGYVYATVPANCGRDVPTVGFIAHMDTSDAAPDAVTCPRVVDYHGGDIPLYAEKGISMTVADYPYLENYRGKHLIVTDGTTLLGADDKAGVAEIVTMAEYFMNTDEPHGEIRIGFTPDEEIGRGADKFRTDRFGAAFAYTVDGGNVGELEYENFNAANARLVFHGVSIHPGSAKGKMKNALRLATLYHSYLPEHEIPEETEGYEGFYHLVKLGGDIEHAESAYIIRDHDRNRFEDRKRVMREVADRMNAEFGAGTVECTVEDSYYNMREIIERDMSVIHRAEEAMARCGVTPVTNPIRGGTDGARLSFMGLPCPNLGTGGCNFHSRFEFACVEEMEKSVEILIEIVRGIVK